MCFTIPYKVVDINDKITLEIEGEKRTAQGSLVSVKQGDFVLLQNGVIIKKISRNDAEEIISLISHYYKKKEEK